MCLRVNECPDQELANSVRCLREYFYLKNEHSISHKHPVNLHSLRDKSEGKPEFSLMFGVFSFIFFAFVCDFSRCERALKGVIILSDCRCRQRL